MANQPSQQSEPTPGQLDLRIEAVSRRIKALHVDRVMMPDGTPVDRIFVGKAEQFQAKERACVSIHLLWGAGYYVHFESGDDVIVPHNRVNSAMTGRS